MGEFFQVLIQAVADKEPAIYEVFEGTAIDFIKCLNCGNEIQHREKYLDVLLPVTRSLEEVGNHSLEKVLDRFLTEELLTGQNQYFCLKCQCKQSAYKGTKFESFPPILLLRLERFRMHLPTFQMIKVMDKVSVPQILNLNPFLQFTRSNSLARQEESRPDPLPKLPRIDTETYPSNTETREFRYLMSFQQECTQTDQDDSPIDLDSISKQYHRSREMAELKMKHIREIEWVRQEGEYVYELYSVLVHCGSVRSGHYCSYIKSLANDRWFLCCDTAVREAEEREVEEALGGETSRVQEKYMTGSRACLLAYRQMSS